MKGLKGRNLILFTSIFLGIILAMQYKTVQENNIMDVTTFKRNQNLASNITRIKEDIDMLKSQIKEAKSIIDIYEQEVVEENKDIAMLYDEVRLYKISGGYKSVEGPGVTVTVDSILKDNIYEYENSPGLQRCFYLNKIISALNKSQAEAISINDQRYTSYTEIERANDHIEINGVTMGPPFVVKAIGNPDKMEKEVLKLRFSYDIFVHSQKEENIIIYEHDSMKTFRYTEPVGILN